MKLNKSAIAVAWNRIQSRIGITDGEARALLAVSCLLLVGAVAGPVLDERDRAKHPVVYLPQPGSVDTVDTLGGSGSIVGDVADSAAGKQPTAAPTDRDTDRDTDTDTDTDTDDRIDINAASVDELAELPGVGPAIARRIVDYRDRYGSYTTVDELAAVRGIGPKTLSRIRDKARI